MNVLCNCPRCGVFHVAAEASGPRQVKCPPCAADRPEDREGHWLPYPDAPGNAKWTLEAWAFEGGNLTALAQGASPAANAAKRLLDATR